METIIIHFTIAGRNEHSCAFYIYTYTCSVHTKYFDESFATLLWY